jgi:hypothetical protein
MDFELDFYKDVRSLLYLFRCNYKMTAELFKFLSLSQEEWSNYELMLEGKINLKIDLSVLSEFGKSLMDHPVVDGNIKFESNVTHFNLLKAC